MEDMQPMAKIEETFGVDASDPAGGAVVMTQAAGGEAAASLDARLHSLPASLPVALPGTHVPACLTSCFLLHQSDEDAMQATTTDPAAPPGANSLIRP